MFDKKIFREAATDNRSLIEKEKDYDFDEIVASVNPVKWIEKKITTWRKFPIFDQNGSGSCVAQTQAKELGIMRWLKDGNYVHFSATDIYQRRKNKYTGGMIFIDARKIAQEGVTLEALVPSQNMSDKEMDGYRIEEYNREIGRVFAAPKYISVPKDIDKIASIIETTGKGVMLWFYFEYKEWTDIPLILNNTLVRNHSTACRHSVTAVDYTLINGEKALIIEDSWGPKKALNGQRVITEEFLKERNFLASYLMNFKFDSDKKDDEHRDFIIKPNNKLKPKYKFVSNLLKGERDEDIIILQDILKYEKLFPSNVKSTGYYGSITSKAVYDFQVKYSVAPMKELVSLGGRGVGPKTRLMLNKFYS